MTGLVIKNTGSWYIVRPEGTSDELRCKVKGNFRLKGIRTTNPVAVGDKVEFVSAPDGSGFITGIEPRHNYIIRRASNLSKESHILASNLDQALLVVTLFHPTTSTTFIDRFLATAEAYRIPVIIAINKVDLLQGDDEALEYLTLVERLYSSIGYKVVTLSAATGEGVDLLRSLLQEKTTLVAGNSGVGKSTLINRLVPGAALRTGEISSQHDTGMHTTTFSQMLDLPGGGFLIDTPGVKGFGTIDFDRHEVGHFFPEIFHESRDCRYGDCTHTHEPGCAVRRAVEEHRISQSRYDSYLSILNEDADKYRSAY